MIYFIIAVVLLLVSFVLAKIKPEYRRLLIIISSVITITYIVWRFTTVPSNSVLNFALGAILLISELIGVSQFFIFEYLFTKNYKLKQRTLSDFAEDKIPEVDVLICTYNEPLKLVEKTMLAATQMNYVKGKLNVYVCDDGKRDELKRLCGKYNIGYITREGNEGAKAGNINNALKVIKGDLFAVLDADMVPTKNFLERTIGYFSEENVAFVQTPQVYYNQDMYQYNLRKKVPNEQDFFMRDIQSARASINAVLHIGTNAVFRKKYVDEIGGYPTTSITEDMAVGMLLQDRGYKTVFINEELVYGLSATTFEDLVKQRDRWCRGNLQVMKGFNPLVRKGLTASQKLAYWDGVLYWFSSLQKMVYIIAPILYLTFGVLILNTTLENLLEMFIPFFLGQILVFAALSPRTRSLKWSHIYEVSMAPHISLSVIREMLKFKIGFNVTPKDGLSKKPYFQLGVAMPHIVLAILSVISWSIGTYCLVERYIGIGPYLINMAWSLYNFMAIITCIKVAYQKPIFRVSERIALKTPMKTEFGINGCELGQCEVINISDEGVGISLATNKSVKKDKVSLRKTKLEIGQDIFVNLHDANNKDSFVKGVITRIDKDLVGVKFKELTCNERKNIVSIYADNLKAYHDTKKVQKYIIEKKTVDIPEIGTTISKG